ncbi:hypothetical protein M2390_000441 [Mycetocola sp. BIGb0189]|uniref:hypothetical protein n=1 Tax=Mycetocola sp. BIGb0189 TaxID=2940604 RepID=UPI002168DC36|nr:hypothetical protein [Mycetocola sp. BIGb0189]MCS4275283.1 hypothetical protein [Mycetocola sp. BIGb0189]
MFDVWGPTPSATRRFEERALTVRLERARVLREEIQAYREGRPSRVGTRQNRAEH